jgi:hypothetical protein
MPTRKNRRLGITRKRKGFDNVIDYGDGDFFNICTGRLYYRSPEEPSYYFPPDCMG